MPYLKRTFGSSNPGQVNISKKICRPRLIKPFHKILTARKILKSKNSMWSCTSSTKDGSEGQCDECDHRSSALDNIQRLSALAFHITITEEQRNSHIESKESPLLRRQPLSSLLQTIRSWGILKTIFQVWLCPCWGCILSPSFLCVSLTLKLPELMEPLCGS